MHIVKVSGDGADAFIALAFDGPYISIIVIGNVIPLCFTIYFYRKSRRRRKINILYLQHALNTTVPDLLLQIHGDLADKAPLGIEVFPLLGGSERRIEVELDDGNSIAGIMVLKAWE